MNEIEKTPLRAAKLSNLGEKKEPDQIVCYSDLHIKKEECATDSDSIETLTEKLEKILEKEELKRTLTICGILITEIPYNNNLAQHLETRARKMNLTVPELMFTILSNGIDELYDFFEPLDDFNTYKRSLLEDEEGEKEDEPDRADKPVVRTVLLAKEKNEGEGDE